MIRPGAIGDFIVSLPALESLCGTESGDYTEVWCAEQNVPLARFAERTQSIISAGLDRLGFLHADDVMQRLRSFDSIISWYGTNRPEFRTLVAELPFEFLPALPLDGNLHAVDFYNRQALGLGGGVASRFPVIPCPVAARTFAVIHPFASSLLKRAPMEVFTAAAEKLSAVMPVHWLCGPEEALPAAVRIGNLYDLAVWLSQARVYVGNDSGISHLAASVGTPVTAFFTRTEARVWAPRGPSVNIVSQLLSADSR